jgi:hypothetical protein
MAVKIRILGKPYIISSSEAIDGSDEILVDITGQVFSLLRDCDQQADQSLGVLRIGDGVSV